MNNVFYKGDDDNGKEAFRKWIHYDRELRTFFRLHQFWHWMLHAWRKCQEEYQRYNISDDAVQISTSPDKQNIQLVVKISNTLELAMSWIIDALSEKTLPRTIRYCNTIKTASSLYSYIMSEIPDCKMCGNVSFRNSFRTKRRHFKGYSKSWQ